MSLNNVDIDIERSIIPLCLRRNAMVARSTVVLSILRVRPDTMAESSLTNWLNWSRRFFSLKLRDFLNNQNADPLIINLCRGCRIFDCYYFVNLYIFIPLPFLLIFHFNVRYEIIEKNIDFKLLLSLCACHRDFLFYKKI